MFHDEIQHVQAKVFHGGLQLHHPAKVLHVLELVYQKWSGQDVELKKHGEHLSGGVKVLC